MKQGKSKFRVAFLGRGSLGYRVLEGLLSNDAVEVCVIICCNPSSDVPLDKSLFRNLALEKKIDYFEANSINNESKKSLLQNCNIDIAVAMLWLNTISTELIKTAKHGFLNLHGGALPRYRGNACQTWAILNEESTIGVTCHLMKGNSLDSGPILKQEFISINPDDLVGDLMKKVENKGVDLVLESVQGFVDGKIETLPQDENEALYCYPRLPRDGEIDWNQSSKKIIKLIRAANHPYPGAYSYFRDHLNDKKIIKLVIRRACVFEDNISSFCAVPGHVIKIKNKICVVCGDDKMIFLQDIELDEKPVSPEKAFNSVRQRLGLNLSDEIIKLRSEINDLRRSLNKST